MRCRTLHPLRAHWNIAAFLRLGTCVKIRVRPNHFGTLVRLFDMLFEIFDGLSIRDATKMRGVPHCMTTSRWQ
jgi:hypothetical protein